MIVPCENIRWETQATEWFNQYHQSPEAQRDWETWQAPYRQGVLAGVDLLRAPSVFEVGCGAGPNLRLLQQARPHLRLGGSEPATHPRLWASEHLGLSIQSGPLPATLPGAEWDVVLSCYVMAYTNKKDVQSVLERCPTRGLILMEPEAAKAPDFIHDDQAQDGKWGHPHAHWNYREMLRDTGWHLWWVWPLPWQNCAMAPTSILLATREETSNHVRDTDTRSV